MSRQVEERPLQTCWGNAGPTLPPTSSAWNTRLRVLHVLDHLGTGGTELGVMKVTQALPADQFENGICVVRGNGEGFLKARTGQQILYAGGPERGSQFSIGRLTRVFRDWKPHVVHSRNWGTIEAIPAAKLARVPIAIHSEHGYELEMLEGIPLRRRLLRRMFYAWADSIFAVTNDLGGYHARQVGWPNDRIATIYNGVDVHKFAPSSIERCAHREALGLSESCFLVGAVGRLVRLKDYSTLLKATHLLASSGVDLAVMFVGDGPEMASLRREACGLGHRVVFLGERSDLPQIFNAMDVFVQTSLIEGMSNTILEAMATGVPTVVTARGGNVELVSDKVTGILFEPGDVTALAATLSLLAKNPTMRASLGLNGRDRAVKEFCLEKMVSAYSQLYTDLAIKKGLKALRGAN